MAELIIVSRHAAGVEFIARELFGKNAEIEYRGFDPSDKPIPVSISGGDGVCIPVIRDATPDDVRGKVVYGNVPLPLAAIAFTVVCIEFAGVHPRGAEYTLADMDAAGARLARYVVRSENEFAMLRSIAGVTT